MAFGYANEKEVVKFYDTAELEGYLLQEIKLLDISETDKLVDIIFDNDVEGFGRNKYDLVKVIGLSADGFCICMDIQQGRVYYFKKKLPIDVNEGDLFFSNNYGTDFILLKLSQEDIKNIDDRIKELKEKYPDYDEYFFSIQFASKITKELIDKKLEGIDDRIKKNIEEKAEERKKEEEEEKAKELAEKNASKNFEKGEEVIIAEIRIKDHRK